MKLPISKIQTNNGQIEGLPKNPRFIRDERFDRLKKSIEDLPEMLNLRELIVYPQNGHYVTIGGNMRLRAAKDLGFKEMPVKVLDKDTPIETLAEIAVKDNVGFGQDDFDILANEWTDFPLTDWGMELPDFETVEETADADTTRVTLADRFLIPPFSVLDARQGYWQDRKRAWMDLGIESERGRGEGLLLEAEQVTSEGLNYDSNLAKGGKSNGLLGFSEQARSHYKSDGYVSSSGKDGKAYRVHRDTKFHGGLADGLVAHRAAEKQGETTDYQGQEQSGTSIFDPVLCEVAYSWFTAPEAKILDPFAGGSVRGIVANYLGRHYTGIDLRPEQIEANEQQAEKITPKNKPRWIRGNSLTDIPQEQFDFVFSCPPYYDLEVYSEDVQDLSTFKTYEAFLSAYREIIKQCIERLADDRFACFCVGDIRDKKGIYRNFVSDTIAAFQDEGAKLYNEAILVTSVGSLPIRVGRQFDAGRKLGKTHQNVLFFVKGDPKKATQNCGKVEIGDIAEAYGEIA